MYKFWILLGFCWFSAKKTFAVCYYGVFNDFPCLIIVVSLKFNHKKLLKRKVWMNEVLRLPSKYLWKGATNEHKRCFPYH